MGQLQKLLWQSRLRLSGDVLGKLAELRRFQHLDRDAAEQLRRKRLKALLEHAYKNVPYYQQALKACGLGDGGVDLTQFNKVLLLDKTALRNHGDALRSVDLADGTWRENTSGGSTGEPVKFIQDSAFLDWSRATKILFDEWTGYRLGERKVILWGSERDLLVGRETLKTHLGRYVRNEVMLNSFKMSTEQMRDYVATLNTFKPKQLRAYVQSAYELARFIEREGLEVHSPQAVMTSAGTLTSPVRTKIEGIFQAPVFNRYGSREVGDIACENAQHDGLYVSPNHFVEILDEQGLPAKPGEVGEIVVTLLTNFAMPLIRYRIGDMGAWAEADGADGLAWPKLREVTGRVTDTFLTQDGTQVHGEYFTHLFYFKDWIEKFQVVQEDYRHIVVKVVPRDKSLNPAHVETELEAIRQAIYTVMGECKIDFEFVGAIPATASGKYRYTLSKVTAEQINEDVVSA